LLVSGSAGSWDPIKGRDGPDARAGALRRSSVETALRLEMTVAATRNASFDNPAAIVDTIIRLGQGWRPQMHEFQQRRSTDEVASARAVLRRPQ
jgi:hypothetical protein